MGASASSVCDKRAKKNILSLVSAYVSYEHARRSGRKMVTLRILVFFN